jgi:uncharacterized membrane protein
MFSGNLILWAISLLCVSGLTIFQLSPKSQAGQRITTLLMISGALTGLCKAECKSAAVL